MDIAADKLVNFGPSRKRLNGITCEDQSVSLKPSLLLRGSCSSLLAVLLFAFVGVTIFSFEMLRLPKQREADEEAAAKAAAKKRKDPDVFEDTAFT